MATIAKAQPIFFKAIVASLTATKSPDYFRINFQDRQIETDGELMSLQFESKIIGADEVEAFNNKVELCKKKGLLNTFHAEEK